MMDKKFFKNFFVGLVFSFRLGELSLMLPNLGIEMKVVNNALK